MGDIALGESRDGSRPGQPQPHLHAVLGLHDGTTRGGHLLEGVVWPTLEVIVREAPAELRKTYRADVGLALIDLDREGPWAALQDPDHHQARVVSGVRHGA